MLTGTHFTMEVSMKGDKSLCRSLQDQSFNFFFLFFVIDFAQREEQRMVLNQELYFLLNIQS